MKQRFCVPFFFSLLIALPTVSLAQDMITVGSVTSAPGIIRVPVFVRDVASTPLGFDAVNGDQIQAISFKVTYSPTTNVTGVAVDRSGGALAGLKPIFEAAPATGNTIAYIGAFGWIPLDSNPPSPGNKILDLVFTVAPGSDRTTILLEVDRDTATLTNQTASVVENTANGGLTLVNGYIALEDSGPRFNKAQVSSKRGASPVEHSLPDYISPPTEGKILYSHTHTGSSPFSPPDEDDTLFVVDSGSGLDTGCTFRSGGPLIINLLVKRVVGEVNSDGTLKDPALLISRGLLSSRARIFLPAFDVDVNGVPGDPTVPPEVDRVFFNGHDLGTLTGDNQIWKLNQFDVPIDWVKFPAQAASGVAPTPAINVIQINIDQASGTKENWCTAVDWAQLEFRAIAPIFLIHGTNAQSDSWDPNFTAFFRQNGSPWSNDINLLPNGTIIGNGGLLAIRLKQLATSFGAKKCHLIAHSKGGADARAYLGLFYKPDELQVASVYTLSTPHHGTVIADITLAGRKKQKPESTNPAIEYLIDHDYWFLGTVK